MISFDLNNIKSSEYYWPVSRDQIRKIDLDVLQFIINYSDNESDSEACKFLLTILPKLRLEIINIVRAEIIKKQARLDGVTPMMPDCAKIWNAVWNEQEIAQSRFTSAFKYGVPKRSLLRTIARPIRGINNSDGFSYRAFSSINFDNDVVCVTKCPLTIEHIKHTDDRVVLVSLSEWFHPPKNTNDFGRTLSDRFVSRFIGDLFELLNDNYDVELSLVSKQYLESWFKESGFWINYYCDRVRSNKKRLPKKLWIGTSGIVWSRMLADVVLEEQGEVVGHDHAWGANFSTTNLMPVFETNNISKYVTFSKAQVDIYTDVRKKYFDESNPVEISYFNLAATTKPKISNKRNDLKRIMYVASFYPCDVLVSGDMMDTQVAVDFQKKLFSCLNKLGFDVMIKPHPQSPQKLPDSLISEFNVEVHTKSFEEECDQADLLIFDYPMSTTWGYALGTDIPILYIDFGLAPLPEKELQLLEQRCSRIEGSFDQDNRAVIDWDLIKSAINSAPDKTGRKYGVDILGFSS